MEEPAEITKYLVGRHHRFKVQGVAPNRITDVHYDMSEYFISAVKIYTETTGLTMKKVDSPYVPTIPSDQLEKLLQSPGALTISAASYLMKLMFGARMAHPMICVAIQRLARYVTKWTAECDRRLHRLYCFLSSYPDWILGAKVSECKNIKNLRIDV